MTIAIIDDEPINRLVLVKIIKSGCPENKIILEDGFIESAIEKINKLKPDIILLDVELKTGTGFDIISALDYAPHIIFTTAYDKYALQAIKAHAFDYILKPINEEELISAIAICTKDLSKNKALKESKEAIKKSYFSYSTNDDKKTIFSNKILYFEGAGAYVFCVTDAEKVLISKNIGEIEKSLDKGIFIRCHQSYIVNITHILKFDQGRSGYLHLTSGEEIPVSQRKMKLITGILGA